MIDHTGFNVTDFARSKAFDNAALGAIGYSLLAEIPASLTGKADVAGYGEAPNADFWIASATPNQPRIHVAFRVDTPADVDRFYKSAFDAGGRDNGSTGPRPHHHANYYGAFVLDPDGHNIETMCHNAP